MTIHLVSANFTRYTSFFIHCLPLFQDRDMISRAIIAISKDSPDGYFKTTSISMFKITTVSHDWERRKNIRRTLSQIPTQFVGNYNCLSDFKLFLDHPMNNYR
jgi:hypothetical protein